MNRPEADAMVGTLDDRASDPAPDRASAPQPPSLPPVDSRPPERPGSSDLLGLHVRGYVLCERIGAGGMGVVYRADQPALGRSVAIKVLHEHLGADESSLARFEFEARAASRLNHPNSVAILDYGMLPDGRPYLVMEYLKGQDLASVLGTEGRFLPLVRVERIVLDLLSVLAEAHELGIVHRDLKPENVMLVRYYDGAERAKVLDFGLARLREQPEQRVTQPGVVVGTPAYMAPEAIAGEELDGRSDLYSLGVMLFELLTGRLPFAERTVGLLLVKQMTQAPPDPMELAPPGRVTRRLADLTLRALAKAPDERFGSAAEMRREVEAAFGAFAEAARRRPTLMPTSTAGERPDASWIEERALGLPVGVRKLLYAAAVLGCVAEVGAIGAMVGDADPSALEPLVAMGIIQAIRAGFVELDPRIQRQVYAMIPVDDRRQMHDRALAWHGARGDPDAVRLEHALRGSEPVVALILLERVADEALERSDVEDAISLSRRAFDLSRRELAHTGDDIFERAHLTFARKLAGALSRAGRRLEAEGVLMEAVDLAPPTSEQRPKLLAALREVRGEEV